MVEKEGAGQKVIEVYLIPDDFDARVIQKIITGEPFLAARQTFLKRMHFVTTRIREYGEWSRYMDIYPEALFPIRPQKGKFVNLFLIARRGK